MVAPVRKRHAPTARSAPRSKAAFRVDWTDARSVFAGRSNRLATYGINRHTARQLLGSGGIFLSQTHEDLGMAVFFLARASETHGLAEDLRRIIEGSGFEVLRAVDLKEGEAADWPVDGSPPARMLIAYDVLPGRVEDGMRQLFPELDNGHIHLAVLTCRAFVPYRVPAGQRFEPVRPSQNSREAWAILRQLSPGLEQELRETIASIRSAMVTDFEVVRDLTRSGGRAKIELIRYGDGLAVKKTYRGNCFRHMEREALFMETFSPHRREIPPVLQRGPNYLIMPFVEGKPLRRVIFGRGFPRLLTIEQVNNIADLLRFVLARGFDPVDLGPHNLLIDGAGRITAFDFEFVYKSDAPIDPEQSACLAGVREGFQGEWPLKTQLVPHLSKLVDPWRFRWRGPTGLTLQSFLYDPPWLQRLKRAVLYPAYLGGKAAGRLFEPLRRATH